MYVERSALRMTAAELERLIRTTHPAHIATVSESGEPHVTPIGVVLEKGSLYMISMVRSRRMRDIARGSQVAVCIDHWGDVSNQHQGAIFYGRCEDASEDEHLPAVIVAFAEKYYGSRDADPSRPRTHQWIRLTPDRVVSWDFRRIPPGADRVSGPAL